MAESANAAVSVTRFPVPPQKIACGFYHTLAISNTEHEGKAEAWSWGQNQHNVCGLLQQDVLKELRKSKGSDSSSAQGFNGVRAAPMRVSALKTDIYEVACGTNHSVFLKKRPEEPGGVLFATGLGLAGRVGMRNPHALPGETLDTEEQWCTNEGPVQVQFKWASGTRVLRVVCGADHTMCYATDKRLYAWGCNGEGQCGVGGTRTVTEPTRVEFYKNTALVHFAAGAQHCLAAGEGGELYTWGCGRNGRHGLGMKREVYRPCIVPEMGEEKTVYVAGGEAHSGAIDSDGQVWMWGAGSYGRLGSGEEADVLAPKRIQTFCDVSDISTVVIKSIALGGFHTLILEAPGREGGMERPGRVFACGVGAPLGLLGEGDRSVVRLPQPITDKKISGRNIVQISAGMFHSLALCADGSLVAWGVGSQGRLGHFETKDKPFCGPTYVDSGLFLQNARMFYGFNSSSQPLFDESERVVREKEEKKQTGPKKPDWEITQFVCGALHSVARTHGGGVYVWGCNANGQLGLGESTAYSWVPRKLQFASRLVKEIASGSEFCLAVTYSQELWSWGKGTDGQLGTGTAKDAFEPQLIHSLSQVVTCAAGETHSAAIVRPSDQGDKAFQLRTWGSAESGMLGIGMDYMSGSQSTPMAVELPASGSLAGGQAVARAGPQGVAVPRPKQVSRGRGAQLALQAEREEPPVGPILVRCGQSHTAVVVGRCDGNGSGAHDVNQVWTFGNGWYGKLGLERRDEVTGHRIPNEGTSSNVYTPQQVNLHGVSARDVALGAYHSCMVSNTNELYVWGRKGEVCEPDELRLPKKFAHIEGQPKIKLAVCGDLHTIAVTTGGEVWVWGDNKMGQLGRGIVGRDEVRMPMQAKLAPGAVDLLDSGPGHTLALFINGESFAWGNQSCGRLGLMDKVYDKIVYDPAKVAAVWCSIESRSKAAAMKEEREKRQGKAAAVEEAEDSDEKGDAQASEQIHALLSDQKVSEFSTMQSLLKQEDPAHQEKALHERYEKLRKSLDELGQDIQKLPEEEAELDRLEAEFDQSVRTNLRWFKVNSPEMDSSRIDPSFIGRLPVYEKLLWVLQQQTTYLAKLTNCISEDEESIFYNTIESLYRSDEGRTRNLFLTLLRLVIDGENDSQSLEDMFNPRSTAFRMISNYSLSPVHYKDLVHAYFFDEQINGTDTLLKAIRKASDTSVFALSLADFREVCDDELKKKEDQDLKAAYAINQDKFRDFLIDPLVKCLKCVELPKDIRQILRHALQAVNNRQFASKPEPGIPPELRKCEPLLRLLCQGVLGPLLRRPAKYASAECFLERSADIIKNDTLIVSNMAAVADFLEQMVENKLDAKQKLLNSATRVLKPELLKYLKQQAEVSSDLETDLMVDTYLMHFERSKHMVRMTSVDLMKLSNTLKKNMTKLRIRENDELENLCNELLQWSPDKIVAAERFAGTNVLHNFVLDPRFMFEDGEIVVCGVSNCLMPARLCGSLVSKEFIKAFEASEDTENPRRVLEKLFRQLEPIKSKNFKDMQAEFTALLATERQKSPMNYEMMQMLNKGVKMVGEMLNVEVSPEDLIQFMSEQLLARATCSQYLGNLERGIERIYSKRTQYIRNLKKWSTELESALNASVSLKLPETFLKQSGGPNLNFAQIGRKLEARRQMGVADPGQMRAIGCSYSPMETYAVSKLKNSGVIVQVHPPFSAMEKKMKITIRALANGGVELIVNVAQGKHQTQVKTLNISEERLLEMQRAEKKEHADIGNTNEDPFLTCVGSAFTHLVTKLRENTA